MTGPAILIFAGAIAIALGGFWASHRQEVEKTKSALEKAEFERELRRRGDEQIILQRNLLEKTNEIAGLYRDIAKKSQIISNKSDEITNLNREILATGIGGESFCYMSTMLKQGIPNFVLVHQGKYPLYDLHARIVDLDKFEEFVKPAPTLENLQKSEVNVTLGNIAPNQANFLTAISFYPKQASRFNIFFSARNGFFTQILRIKKVGTEWKTALKVTREKNGKEETFFEKIDDGYPLNEKGLIQW